MKKTSASKKIADTIKNNPKEIIKWAKSEILEYQKLIKILKKNDKK